LQGVWSCLLCLSGTYGQLLDFTMFAALLFYIATIGGLFVLRFKRPNADRPYRAFGYPVLPALYIAMAAWILYRTIALQTTVHMAGADNRFTWRSGVLDF
jgi:APA family basic amino acid/polyamine antiporter